MNIESLSARETRDEFLQLLVTQLQNQNPLEPISQEDFLSQLAQFSTLEGIEKLNETIEDQGRLQQDTLRYQQLTQGAALIGRNVSYEQTDSDDTSRILTGRVESVSLDGKQVSLRIDGQFVDWQRVRSVGTELSPTEPVPVE